MWLSLGYSLSIGLTQRKLFFCDCQALFEKFFRLVVQTFACFLPHSCHPRLEGYLFIGRVWHADGAGCVKAMKKLGQLTGPRVMAVGVEAQAVKERRP